MLKIDGYQIFSQIYESANSAVYRGMRQADDQKIILKMLKEDYPIPAELARYKQEYELTSILNQDGVIKTYGLEKYHNTLVMLVEDFGGESLTIIKQNHQFSLEEFLLIANKIADSLGQIHAANIIHKDINPANIILNRETQQLKIIDFGISTRLTRENPTLKNPHVLEGTLPYISPEQTGRMNRSLDYRTDFYSLGVTFYELLTGKLPFDTKDDLELVHCHIAKQPILPSAINSSIPAVIDNIVMKLMAKNAEDRYQSAWGLKADLTNCLQQLQTTGNIDNFALATQDISDKFQIPQKLYGRATEIQTLLESFELVTQSAGQLEGKKLILVAGYSGIGKSALVREIYKPITEKKGYFISGKFDQFQRNIPYSAVVQALGELIKQLLTESEASLMQWREKLLIALGMNGQIIIDVIPELELIIGKQPAVAELGANESQNRFNFVFQNFIKIFTQPAHPLALFLDDLQWADGASLKLMQLLMAGDAQGLFLIGAYRDNEVYSAHPLILTLDEIAKNGTLIERISLSPLNLETIAELIGDALKTTSDNVKSLAELVLLKTGGNPFFLNEFLRSLYTEDLLKFDHKSLGWCWNLNEIKQHGFTDNVVELMTQKIQKLPSNTQELLKRGAAIGNQFDLAVLGGLESTNIRDIVKSIEPAIIENLVISLEDREDIELALLETPNYQLPTYKFIHDRIQQAAYSLIPEKAKKLTHLQIAELLLRHYSEVEIEEKLFDIVGHFNLAIELIQALNKRQELAQLNLKAGIKARNSTAYSAAIIYLQTGIDLLRENYWQNQYELTLNLYVAATEAKYLNADLAGMEQMATQVLQNAQNILDKMKIYEIQIAALTAQSQMLEAIALGREALKQLGVELPSEPDESKLKIALDMLDRQINGKPISALIDLPIMIDRPSQIAMQILGMLTPPVFMGMPGLLPLVSVLMVNISLQFGNTPASTVGYGSYAIVLCAFFGEVQTGYEFGQLALKLAEKLNVPEFKSMILLTFATFVQQYQEPFRNTIPNLKAGYMIGMETGTFLESGYNLTNYVYTSFFSGVELASLEQEIIAYSAVMAQIKQSSPQTYLDMQRQMILNLMEPGEQPDCLIGIDYDERVMIPKHYQDHELTAIAQLYIYKLMLAYLSGNYSHAQDYIAQTHPSLMGVAGMSFIAIFHFYAALSYLALYPSLPEIEQAEILVQVENHQTILEAWAKKAPFNYQNKLYLVEAQKYQIVGNKAKAIEYYDLAILGAKENQFIQEEALANELAAKFYLSWGKEKIAQNYMQSAHYTYTLWGAWAKVQQLEEKYPQLLTLTAMTPRMKGTTTTRISSGGIDTGATLDLATVMKASQAISGEIVLEKLLVSLMKIIIQNAGAQIGHLVLENQGKLVIKASGLVNDHQIKALQSMPLENILPVTLVNYVARLQEYVVLNNATCEGNFINDPYILINKPLSILSYPLLNQGKLVGIVYLENNLTTGAFTADRMQLLQLLAGQVAISITNAMLYAEKEEYARTLEQKVSDRTAELQAANQKLLQLANLDGLTQIANRRRFDDYLGVEWQRHLRKQEPLGLILIDIDYFKKYNDYYGHQGGDNCLIQVAQTIRQIPQRATDLVARYGGEEFTVILPNTAGENALIVAKEIRRAIAVLQIPHATSLVSNYITLSLGIASMIPTLENSPEDLINKADQALYFAKEQGRDRAIFL